MFIHLLHNIAVLDSEFDRNDVDSDNDPILNLDLHPNFYDDPFDNANVASKIKRI